MSVVRVTPQDLKENAHSLSAHVLSGGRLNIGDRKTGLVSVEYQYGVLVVIVWIHDDRLTHKAREILLDGIARFDALARDLPELGRVRHDQGVRYEVAYDYQSASVLLGVMQDGAYRPAGVAG